MVHHEEQEGDSNLLFNLSETQTAIAIGVGVGGGVLSLLVVVVLIAIIAASKPCRHQHKTSTEGGCGHSFLLHSNKDI